MARIAITTTSFAEHDAKPLEMLKGRGFEVVLNRKARKLKGEEVVSLCPDAIGLIAGTETLDAAVMKGLKSLKVISRCGTGLENIDMDAAKKRGIRIFNTPDAPTVAVAELAVGLMLDLLRNISRMDRAVRKGAWKKEMGSILSGKRVGIIGYGRIGKKAHDLIAGFGCDVAYADPASDSGVKKTKRLPMEELLKWADIITVHASTKERILGERELRMMKKGSFLVNVSRGEIIDEAALCRLLKEGRLAGAALDVFEKEPYSGSLAGLENVVLTPHVGSYAREARINMEKEAASNLLKGLEVIQ